MAELAARISGQTAHSGSIDIRTQVIGLDRTIEACRQLGNKAAQGLAEALVREAQAIMVESKLECPVGHPPEDKHPGTLRSTGTVLPARMEGRMVVVELGYGGPAAPYALRQHEELSYRHRVGNAKFLETPARRHFATIDQRMAEDLKRRLLHG